MAMDLKSTLDKLARTCQKYSPSDESKTKSYLIVPLLRDLGYDVSDPSKVIPEYDADPRDKKTGKVDYAIVDSNRQPIIYIEAKKLHDPLDQQGHYNQVKRYYNNESSVRFAVLTNGYEYRFYTDLDDRNLLDSEPFLSFTLENYTDTDLEHLSKFHIENFDATKVRDLALELSYQSKILEYLKGEISGLDSFDLVKFVTKKVLNSTAKSNYLIVKKILPSVLKNLISSGSEPKNTEPVPPPVVIENSKGDEHLKFWEGFKRYVSEREFSLRVSQKVRSRHYLTISFGSSKAQLFLTRNTRKKVVSAEIWIRDNQALYQNLFDNKKIFEDNLDESIEWLPLEGKKTSKFCCYHYCDPKDKELYHEYYDWLIRTSEKLVKTFKSITK